MRRECSASISESQMPSVVRACRLESRLLERMRCGESRQLEAAVGEASHHRKSVQFKFEKMRAHDLTGDADIRKAGLRAQGKRSRGAAREQPFIGRKPFARPMLAPALDRFGIGAKRLGEMIADARHHQGMRIGNRHQRQRARIGPLLCVFGYQSRFGLNILKIFDNRQRLEHGMAVANKRRHDTFGIDSFITRFELLSGKNVDRNFLKRQTLEPERNPQSLSGIMLFFDRAFSA